MENATAEKELKVICSVTTLKRRQIKKIYEKFNQLYNYNSNFFFMPKKEI